MVNKKLRFHNFRTALQKFIQNEGDLSGGWGGYWHVVPAITAEGKVGMIKDGFEVLAGTIEVATVRSEKNGQLVIHKGKDIGFFFNNEKEEDRVFFKKVVPAMKEEFAKSDIELLSFAECFA